MESTLRQIIIAVTAALVVTTSAFAANMSDSAIAERIKPVGSVYLEGDAPAKQMVNTGPRSGDDVYGTYCVACHSAGIAGAPATKDAAAWAPRIAQGMEVMTDHAIKGFNAMPAKGTCMNCTDDEIIAAINVMIEGL